MGIVKSDKVGTEYLYEYKDEGCEVSEVCVECPLPKCKHDDKNWFVRYKIYAKKRDVLHLLKEGKTSYEALADKSGNSVSTMRILQQKIYNKEIDLSTVDMFYKALYK